MTETVIIAGLALVGCVLVVAWMAWRSREGHEDKSGFRFGAPPPPEDAKKADESKVA